MYCQVDTVSDGHAALERVRNHVYDLILSDLRMPEMDGPTFYRRMKVEHPALVE
jgi:CheY-like chemotaxis protein